MPKVSVIIPVYGVENYIERCARSLFEQTLDDIEYIFVDDCTPDRSIEMLKSIIEKYRLRFAEEKKIVRIVRMPTNSGLPAVRRHGIQLATGDYIIHCDSDDWVDLDMYRAMYEKAIEDSADVVVCDYFTHNGTKVLHKYEGCRTTDKDSLLKELMFQKKDWAVWNKMVRRETYFKIEYYPVGAMGEDMVLSLQLVYYSNIISYINTPLYYYFFNEYSISHAKSPESVLRKVNQLLENYELIEKFIIDKQMPFCYNRALNYIKYTIKSKLYSTDEVLASKRKQIFPFIEFKILFYREVSFIQKKQAIKRILFSFGIQNTIQ